MIQGVQQDLQVPAEVGLPLLDDLKQIVNPCLLFLQLAVRRRAIVVRLLRFDGLETFPLLVAHVWWLDVADQVRIGLFELPREPVRVCSKDGAGLHEFGVDLDLCVSAWFIHLVVS